MKIPDWSSITVEQYKNIHEAVKLFRPDMTETEKVDIDVRIICILADMTERQVDELTMQEFSKLSRQINFLFTSEIPGKPQRIIKADGKLFKVNYQVEKQRFGQYIESVSFAEDVVENLHLLMASVCNPVKKYGPVYKELKNDSNNHSVNSEAMLKARFIDVYHTAVFFYRVYRGSIKTTQDYLKSQMIRTGRVTKEQAENYMMDLINVLDGCITPRWSKILREYV